MIHGLLSVLREYGLELAYQGTGMAVELHDIKPEKSNRFWRLKLSAELESRISMALGVLFLTVAVGGLALLGGPVIANEIRQKFAEVRLSRLSVEERAEVEVVNRVGFGDYTNADPIPSNLNPVSAEFGVVIPKIGVNSLVVPQVSASDSSEYLPALKQGLAQAAGSVNPGEKGDIFIFGHSTDYAWNVQRWNALFYNLKELEEGDKIYVYHQGEAIAYKVTGKGIYEPKDVSFLDPNNEKERLVLQTCWPPGTILKRLIVFAEPVSTLSNSGSTLAQGK